MEMHTIMVISGLGGLFLLMTWAAIIDIATKEFSSQHVKIGWGITVALIPFIGCILYFIFGFGKGKKQKKTEADANSD